MTLNLKNKKTAGQNFAHKTQHRRKISAGQLFDLDDLARGLAYAFKKQPNMLTTLLHRAKDEAYKIRRNK